MGAHELLIKINGNAKQFTDELNRVKKTTANLEKGLLKVAKVSAAGFVALAGAIGITVTRFAKFEKTFTNVQTLLDKSSFKTKTFEKGVNDLRQGVIKLGAESGESFESLNQSLFDLVSAGVDAEESINTLTAATELAIAGATDTATATKALTAALTSYGSEAGTAQQIAQKFFTAQKFGVTTVGALGKSMNKVVGIGKQLGISFNELLAASTALTANGAKPTEQAFTEMKAVLNSVILAQSKLTNESAEVQNALSLQNIENVGLVAALKQTFEATGENEVRFQKLLGSAEALSAALSLTGDQASTFTKIMTEMSDEQKSAATFSEALATKQATTEQAFKRLGTSIDAAAIVLGEVFAPMVVDVANSLTEMAKNFAALDKESIRNLATLGKVAAAILALITATTLGTIVVIKFIQLWATARKVMAGARIGAIALTTTLSFGLVPILLTIISFLPEILSGFKALSKVFSKKPDLTGIKEVSNRLEALKNTEKKLIALREEGKLAGANVFRLAMIQAEIDKLDTLKKTLAGVGSLDIARQEKAAAKEEVTKSTKTDDAKKEADRLVQIESDAAVRRTEIRDAEIALLQAKDQGASDALIAARQERLSVLKEIDALEKEEELTRASDQNEAVKEQELEFFEEKLELLEERRDAAVEREAELFEEDQEREKRFNQFDEKQKALFNKKEEIGFQKRVLTRKEATKLIEAEKINSQITADNKELIDRQKHGVAVAKLNRIMDSQELRTADQLAGQFVALRQSKDSKLKAIGKAAALVQIGIDTARGAIAAYTALAGIPIVGPGLGLFAAAALTAFGLERAAEVSSAQRGGIVPSGAGGLRDRVPLLTEPGEIIVPKPLVPDFIQSMGRPEIGAAAGGDAESPVVIIEMEDEAAEFITAQQREDQALGIGAA